MENPLPSHLNKMYVGLGESHGNGLEEGLCQLEVEREKFFEQRLVSKVKRDGITGDRGPGAFLVKNSIGGSGKNGRGGKDARKNGK